MRGLSTALSSYEFKVSRGLTHSSTANQTISSPSADYAPQRSLRDAATAARNVLPQSSAASSLSTGSMAMAVPEVVLAASDSARNSLHACLEAFK